MTALRFFSGKCVEAHAEPLTSKSMNEFFAKVTAHYLGKGPEEIEKHARAWSESVKEWPAPRDALVGWALTQTCVRMQLNQFADEAEAARKENLRTAQLEKIA